MNLPKPLKNKSSTYVKAEDMILKNYPEKPYRLTPLMVTFSEEVLTHIDIQNFIELNLHIVRFKMTHVTRKDKLKLLAMLRKAQRWVCEKYDVNSWPVAICVDIPNAAIRSGYIDDDVCEKELRLSKGAIVTITSDVFFFKKMNLSTIFIDDPYTIQEIRPGAEITICGGSIKLICVETIDEKNIKCKVTREGILDNNQFVAVRGTKHTRPALLKQDLEFLDFAKELQFDVITVFSVRNAKTIERIKMYNGTDYEPLIISTICDQEGLDNIEEIIKVSDGIILSREILFGQLINQYSLPAIQMKICAMCKREGKTFFLSGNILEQTLIDGSISTCDLSDITNAVLQGAGLVMRQFNDAKNALEAMKILHSVCKSIENSERDDGFWRIIEEYRMPIDAAEGCILACAIMIRQTQSLVVIIPTVTGRTAIQLSRMSPLAIIITISRDPRVARKLQIYRGIYAIIYDKKPKSDWHQEREARIHFAVAYGIKMDLFKYGHIYITFGKSGPASSFCDNISCWTVTAKETRHYRRLSCEGPSLRLQKSTQEHELE